MHKMQKTFWSFALGAVIATGGAVAVSAQQGSGPPADRGGMMQQHGGGPRDDGRPGMMGQGQGMMMGQGQGMMGQGRGPMHGDRRHGARDHGMGGPGMMAMMMILMDENADRAVSLEEFQAAHARIFKYADADNDGKLTTDEMRGFFRGLHGGDDDD